jgi:hypothetical protein
MKTSQAVRNIRKYKRRVEVAPKGRMVTDDYGNKLSVKKKPDGTFGRRHTLSQGKKRAIALGGDSVSEGLSRQADRIKNHDIYRKGEKGIPVDAVARRHATSALRRIKDPGTGKNPSAYNMRSYNKQNYHSNRRASISDTYTNGATYAKQATTYAKEIHKGTKRKAKDFTK